ncbi:hypothetical protein HY634_01165 [Candidatus Uhrbacteria bacterium]|nr:hypothetical protein [Candidatus Uhrbacteria bacterium]
MTRIALLTVLGLTAASCLPSGPAASSSQTTTQAKPSPPPDRPATYGAPRSLGGQARQWSLLITVDALKPGDTSWYHQSCTDDVEESSRRQTLFAERLDTALTSILIRNPHCALSTIAPLPYGGKGCNKSDTSQPSGAYVVFSCPNSEPMNTTTQVPSAPLP